MKTLISPQIVILAAVIAVVVVIGGCGSKVEGTYSNGSMVTLDLKSGGKAMFTMMGESIPCVYKTTNDKVLLDCTPKGRRWTSSSTATGRFPVQASSGT